MNIKVRKIFFFLSWIFVGLVTLSIASFWWADLKEAAVRLIAFSFWLAILEVVIVLGERPNYDSYLTIESFMLHHLSRIFGVLFGASSFIGAVKIHKTNTFETFGDMWIIAAIIILALKIFTAILSVHKNRNK